MESTIYIFIFVYLFRDIASIYLPKTKKKGSFCWQREARDTNTFQD